MRIIAWGTYRFSSILDSIRNWYILTVRTPQGSFYWGTISRWEREMNEQINQETFAHLVDLAALQLTTGDAEYLRQQLNNQLKAIQELEAIPLDEDVPVTSHGVPYTTAISPA